MTDSHVTIQNTADGGYLLRCQHCGAELRPKLPIPLDEFGRLCKTFDRTHQNCQQTAVSPLDQLLLFVETNIQATAVFMNGGNDDLFWEGKITGLSQIREEILRLLGRE